MKIIKVENKELLELIKDCKKTRDALHSEIISLSHTITSHQKIVFSEIEKEYTELENKEYSVDYKNGVIIVLGTKSK